MQHFTEVLNHPTTVNPQVLEELTLNLLHEEITQSPNTEEVQKFIKQMNSGKLPGNDRMPAEVFKLEGSKSASYLYEVIEDIWEMEKIFQDFKDATNLTIATTMVSPCYLQVVKSLFVFCSIGLSKYYQRAF